MNIFIESLAFFGVIILALYVLTFVLLPIWFRRFSSDAAITALKVSRKPALLTVLFIGLKISFYNLELASLEAWIQQGLNVAIIITVTYVISQLFTQIIIYYFKLAVLVFLLSTWLLDITLFYSLWSFFIAAHTPMKVSNTDCNQYDAIM